MPAAELSRLRAQINGLIERFDDPVGFRAALRDLLDLYSNRAYRPGEAIKPQPLLPSYRVPPLVSQRLELELGKTCQEQPEQALKVVDALWQEPTLEPRILAAQMLGSIPAVHGKAVVETLRRWAQPGENFRMLDTLFMDGMAGLRQSAPNLLIALFEEWLSSDSTDKQAMGIRALVPLIKQPGFENLPPVFRLLSSLVQIAPPALNADLQAVMEVLAARSPTETAYFLRQALSISPRQSTARLVRRCLPLFDAAQQAGLRAALKTALPG